MLVPFFKLFFGPKNDFFSTTFFCDHYALVFLLLLHNLILLYFDSICTRLEKFLRKWTRKVCPKMRSTKHFWEKTCGARRFAELFLEHARHDHNALTFNAVLKVTKNHLAENCDILTSLGRIWGVCACPKIGVSYFQKTSTPIFGTWLRGAFFQAGQGSDVRLKFNMELKKLKAD